MPMILKRSSAAWIGVLGAITLHFGWRGETLVSAAAPMAPKFEVDLMWPKPLPNHWLLGTVIGVAVDARDHIWVIHRPNSLEQNELHATFKPQAALCCAAAPAILEFNQEGDLLRHWGGPGEGYDWPLANHGITVDSKGNVWIGGSGRGGPPSAPNPRGGPPLPPPLTALGELPASHDNMILKFTQDGKFLMQIGKPNRSKGSNDVENLRLPAKIFVDPKTNEVYVADGYGNHRIIVYDADTGMYKRHWGAYGHKPDDAELPSYDAQSPAAQQFGNAVHCAELSHDGLLYVCDRSNDRIQVFKPDGTFVKEAFIAKETLASGSVWDLSFSQDPAQSFVYVVDGENNRVHILSRASLEVLTAFGDGGRQPGEFYGVHNIATDSKGNIYTTETFHGQRVQRFRYKGLAPVTKMDQGILWPSRK